jgi:hypothetical protein
MPGLLAVCAVMDMRALPLPDDGTWFRRRPLRHLVVVFPSCSLGQHQGLTDVVTTRLVLSPRVPLLSPRF